MTVVNKVLKEKTSREIITIINKYIKNMNSIRKSIRTTRRFESDDIIIISIYKTIR